MKIIPTIKGLGLYDLGPDYRIIEKIGSTGAGKTLTDMLFTTPDALKVLNLAVGEGSATLRDQVKVFTEKLTHHIVVAAKLDDDIYSWEQLISLVLKAMTRVIKLNYKDSQIQDVENIKSSLINFVVEILEINRNTVAQTHLLKKNERIAIAREIAEYSIVFLQENLQTIYYSAKNSLQDIESKNNSRKFDEAISHKLQEAIDDDGNYVSNLKRTHTEINDRLKKFFYLYFLEDKKSNDDYYYRVIDLDDIASSMDFIEAIFSNNNLNEKNNLSIEVLCKELIVYAPMKPEVVKLIRNNYKMKQVLEGSDSKISLGIRDTRGLYHECADQQKESEYLQDLLYNRTFDALMIVCPIFGDQNHSKLREDIKAVLKVYTKQVPIILLNNKVDLLIDDLYKPNNEINLFDFDESIGFEPNLIDFDDLKINIDQRIDGVTKDFKDALQKRSISELKSIPCYFKLPSTDIKSISKKLFDTYGPKQALEQILGVLCDSLYSTSNKLVFRLKNEIEEGRLPFRIDEESIKIILNKHFNNTSINKQFKAAIDNINSNKGLRPHGQGYNALGNHLLVGEGWSSNIDSSYYINCESFNISFPTNITNIITNDLLDVLIKEAVIFTKGDFESVDDFNKLKDLVIRNLRKTDFTVNLLYDIYDEADKFGFSYRTRFNRFLKLSLKLIEDVNSTTSDKSMNRFSKAIRETLRSSISYLFKLNVYIK